MQSGDHFGAVAHPLTGHQFLVEGIGIRIEQYALGLAVYHPSQQGLQFIVFGCQRKVRPHLCGAVAQPHGMDVAGDDKRIGLPVTYAMFHRGIEGVGETIPEHPGQFGIPDLRLGGQDGLFHRLGGKVPFTADWPKRGIINAAHSGKCVS